MLYLQHGIREERATIRRVVADQKAGAQHTRAHPWLCLRGWHNFSPMLVLFGRFYAGATQAPLSDQQEAVESRRIPLKSAAGLLCRVARAPGGQHTATRFRSLCLLRSPVIHLRNGRIEQDRARRRAVQHRELKQESTSRARYKIYSA
ncbi:hypothetical protein MKZ38_002517 [Zalerion maritima]|uniref:Uncharacterized protein n=1 Tax=Zalerion maritima TaxID=339359 RepID=A0AAD5WSF4_9PEZI|nr:hypothetical protein MKZ38_002517 [Zalerion maritima]